MTINITMPALSPTMEEGSLAKWLVKEGDTVSAGDIIAEIETDKATMEVEAVDEGEVGRIVVAEGTEGVKVNAVIAVLLEDGESADDIEDGDAGGDKKGGKSKSEPEENKPAEDEPEPETPPKDDKKADPKPASKQEQSTSGTKAPAAPKNEKGERIFASPLARRIAADKGLDLSGIKGSGPKGRIVKADVETAEPNAKTAPDAKKTDRAEAPAPEIARGASADQVKKLYGDRAFEEVKLDGMRKAIAARLSEAKQTIPHFYLRRDIELDPLLSFRSDLNKGLEAKGVKISVNDFIIKACALALQDVPDCNAAWAGDRTLKFEASDVAVAVAIDGGLMTPVIRDAEAKTISRISSEMKDLVARAKDRKLAPQEYQGGAFSVSNLGMMGIENFDAVINPPHGAILAVGAGLKKPVVRGDQVEIATVMSVTLSVDHRVIDGALGAELLASIKTYLEEPMSMLV